VFEGTSRPASDPFEAVGCCPASDPFEGVDCCTVSNPFEAVDCFPLPLLVEGPGGPLALAAPCCGLPGGLAATLELLSAAPGLIPESGSCAEKYCDGSPMTLLLRFG
jgi:hypothetical protein